MSYDIRLCVKVADMEETYVEIGLPEYYSPTYNLRDMFVACMNWDYEQGKYYRCSDVIERIKLGISNLSVHRNEFIKYNAPNGWGTIDDAFEVLYSLRESIYSVSEYYELPLEHLYMKW